MSLGPKILSRGGGVLQKNKPLGRQGRRVKVDSYGNKGEGEKEVSQESKKSLGPQFYMGAKFRKLKPEIKSGWSSAINPIRGGGCLHFSPQSRNLNFPRCPIKQILFVLSSKNPYQSFLFAKIQKCSN